MFTKDIIDTIRQMAPVSFLATLEVNQARLRAMTHYVDDDLTIWYPSLKRSGKVKQIIFNSKVCD